LEKKIYSGIIVYRPEKNLIRLVEKLIKQKSETILFINEGNKISDEIISRNLVTYFKPNKNLGIAVGLNKIITHFKFINGDYLFTFDQDSDINNNFINDMISLYQKAVKIDNTIITCSPKIKDTKFSKKIIPKQEFIKRKNDYEYVKFAITSGTLFVQESFNRIGYMNQSLFIDGVDSDWCERVLLRNFRMIMAENIYLYHKIGYKYINFFGVKKSYHDQDIRVYYIIRNSIYLLLRGSNTYIWKYKELIKTFIRMIAYPILSSTKFSTIFYVLLAIRDALFNNMGKMNYIDH
tara:strand:+ start:882 stop:1760 length:879 start_codon:yes stop_codon:yes gene_type:complete